MIVGNVCDIPSAFFLHSGFLLLGPHLIPGLVAPRPTLVLGFVGPWLYPCTFGFLVAALLGAWRAAGRWASTQTSSSTWPTVAACQGLGIPGHIESRVLLHRFDVATRHGDAEDQNGSWMRSQRRPSPTIGMYRHRRPPLTCMSSLDP